MKKKAPPSRRRSAASSPKPATQTKKKSARKIAAQFGANNPLFQLTPIPSYVWRRQDGNFLLAEYNAAADQTSGGRAKDFLGASARLVYADRPDILRQIGECFASHSTLRAQMPYVIPETTDELQLDVTYIFIAPDGVLVQIENLTPKLRAQQQAKTKTRQLAALYETSLQLAANHELRPRMEYIVDRAAELLNATIATLLLYDPAGDNLRIELWKGPAEPPTYQLKMGESAAGQAAVTRKPVRTNNYPAWEFRSPTFENIVSAAAAVPLVYSNELIGVLAVIETTGSTRQYSEDDVNLLSLFGSQVAGAIRNVRLYDEAQQRLAELESIDRVSKTLRSAETLEQMLQDFLAATLKTVNARDGAIWLYDRETGKLQQEFAIGWPKVLSEPESIVPDEGITGHIFKTGASYRTREFASDAKTHPAARPQVPPGWGGVGVPLFHGEQVVGAMFVSVQLPRETNAHEEWLIKILGEVGGTAIHRMRLYSELGRKASELSFAYEATLEGWARALDIRDQETESHTRRTVDLTLGLARALNVPEEDMLDIRQGALLHDIGKMGVPDSILRKPGPLTEEERREMQKHPQFAFDMLRHIKYLANALTIPYFHHEYWDGSGYPQGLKGEDIPLAARIFSVADVYDALISARPYRAAWTREEALKYIAEHAGTQFDPQVAGAFLEMMQGDRQKNL